MLDRKKTLCYLKIVTGWFKTIIISKYSHHIFHNISYYASQTYLPQVVSIPFMVSQ